jgi:hypothetical protein
MADHTPEPVVEKAPAVKRRKKPETEAQRKAKSDRQKFRYANDPEFRARRIAFARGYDRVPKDAPPELQGKCYETYRYHTDEAFRKLKCERVSAYNRKKRAIARAIREAAKAAEKAAKAAEEAEKQAKAAAEGTPEILKKPRGRPRKTAPPTNISTP